MSDLYLTKNFITRAKKIHKGKPYSYEKVSCTNHLNRVTITCLEHGPFSIQAYAHITGRGCRKCSADARRLSTEEVSNRLQKYGLTFDPESYTTNQEPMKAFCEIHGAFEDSLDSISDGGCPRCKHPYRLIPDFILHIKKLHGDRPSSYHNLVEPILASTVLDVYCLNCKVYSHPTVQNHLRSKTNCKFCWDGRRNMKE